MMNAKHSNYLTRCQTVAKQFVNVINEARGLVAEATDLEYWTESNPTNFEAAAGESLGDFAGDNDHLDNATVGKFLDALTVIEEALTTGPAGKNRVIAALRQMPRG